MWCHLLSQKKARLEHNNMGGNGPFARLCWACPGCPLLSSGQRLQASKGVDLSADAKREWERSGGEHRVIGRHVGQRRQSPPAAALTLLGFYARGQTRARGDEQRWPLLVHHLWGQDGAARRGRAPPSLGAEQLMQLPCWPDPSLVKVVATKFSQHTKKKEYAMN
jgi:hypothetical protein